MGNVINPKIYTAQHRSSFLPHKSPKFQETFQKTPSDLLCAFLFFSFFFPFYFFIYSSILSEVTAGVPAAILDPEVGIKSTDSRVESSKMPKALQDFLEQSE